MAVRERAKNSGGPFHSFSSRMPEAVYKDLNDWAWEQRLTLAAACGILLKKALATERGEDYTTESGETFTKGTANALAR